MATAPEQEAGTAIPGEQIPVNFEVEARKMGWTPADEFKGDPKHHLDAETFYTRAVEYMPIAKATIKKQSARIDALERAAKQSSEFFSKAEERAYQRALDEIRREQEAAVENGDVEAHRAASKKLDALEKPTAKPAADDPEQRAEDFADWGKANKWYATNALMQSYADSQAQMIAQKKGGFLDRADLDALSEKVKEKFAEDFPEAFGAEPAPRQKRPPVDGGGNRQGARGGKTYADLPPEARAMCDKWVKNGLTTQADYVKSFDFDGYAKAAR